MSESAATSSVARPTLSTLFFGFLKVGLSGFGGVMPFARRMLVEERRWLTEAEFLDVLSLSQFLPGPNIVNASVIIGRKFHGVSGSIAATGGLMLMPLVIILALATVYGEFAQIGAVRDALSAMSASASGLIVATALKLARPIRGSTWQLGVAAAVFVAIGFFRVPLVWVLAIGCPASLALAWTARR